MGEIERTKKMGVVESGVEVADGDVAGVEGEVDLEGELGANSCRAENALSLYGAADLLQLRPLVQHRSQPVQAINLDILVSNQTVVRKMPQRDSSHSNFLLIWLGGGLSHLGGGSDDEEGYQ